MPKLLLYTIIGVNVLTFLAFGLDKVRAIKKWRRTPESWLIFFVFCTGILGGWGGMMAFRHKVSKGTFQGKMLVATIFNLAWVILYCYW